MSAILSEIKIRTHPLSLLQDSTRVSSAHRGELIHLALYFLDHFEGIEDIERSVLRAFALQGRWRRRWEIDNEYIKPIFNAISLPQARPWFEKNVVNLREVDVVDAHGDVHRVDRMIRKEGELEVIDFKMGQREEEHLDQVSGYKELVEMIFHRPTRGYLLYIDEPSVVALL
jgi:ATP-dependent exoDNAse (exonuclease V) beta subunit